VDRKDLTGLKAPRDREETKVFKVIVAFREGMATRGPPGIRGSRALTGITVLLVPRGTQVKREQEVSATSVGASRRSFSKQQATFPVVILRI